MVAWFAQRLFLFGVFGLLLNFLAVDFQLEKNSRGSEVWEVKKPVVFQETDPSARSRELFFASPKLPESESESESVSLTSDQTERNLAITLDDEVYIILGLFIGTKIKTVTLRDVKQKIIELGTNDLLPNGQKIKDISVNSLTLSREDGSLEFIDIYERSKD